MTYHPKNPRTPQVLNRSSADHLNTAGAARPAAAPFLKKASSQGKAMIQLKEETELKPGMLNMIGETHTDYSGRSARRYEAAKIRDVSALGPTAKYFTESMLKTGEGNPDYADPVHLRVAQAVAFIRKEYVQLMPQLKKAQTMNYGAMADKSEAQKLKVEALVREMAPMVFKDDFDAVEVIGLIKSKNLDLDVLEKLSHTTVWDSEKNDPDYKYNANLNALSDLIAEERDERDDEVDYDNEEVDPEQYATDCALGLKVFYEEFKGRLPGTLQLYFHLKDTQHYRSGDGHFKFEKAKIPKVLEEWDKLAELCEHIQEVVLRKKEVAKYQGVINTCVVRFASLVKVLEEGVDKGAEVMDVTSAKLKRSIAMHEAAEQLKNENIAWKVGRLHVEDIKKLEGEGEIGPVNYTYITKENFWPRYINEVEMKGYEGTDTDLGPSYIATLESKDKIMAQVKEKLKNRPWESNYSSIVHLDLGNIVTDATGLIVKAAEAGALPALKKLTIHKMSMTPELRGRLLSRGVEVVLTGL